MKLAYWNVDRNKNRYQLYEITGRNVIYMVVRLDSGKFQSWEREDYEGLIFELIEEARRHCEQKAVLAGYRVLTSSEQNLL